MKTWTKETEHPQYLLRFDDICPTMNWEVWTRIEALLLELRIQPLLAVVPDNQDEALKIERPAADFWERVRSWQDRGWTIGFHGYQHKYVTRDAGLVATRKKSEFAGLSIKDQEEKLERGMAIFRKEGIRPKVWVAPGNSFDAVTVALLPRFGIRVISDGCFYLPYTCSCKLTWVPQQLFYFRKAAHGLWTVCFHHNHWTRWELEEFDRGVREYARRIVSLENILDRYRNRRSFWCRWLCMHPRVSRVLLRSQLKFWSYQSQGNQANEITWVAETHG